MSCNPASQRGQLGGQPYLGGMFDDLSNWTSSLFSSDTSNTAAKAAATAPVATTAATSTAWQPTSIFSSTPAKTTAFVDPNVFNLSAGVKPSVFTAPATATPVATKPAAPSAWDSFFSGLLPAIAPVATSLITTGAQSSVAMANLQMQNNLQMKQLEMAGNVQATQQQIQLAQIQSQAHSDATKYAQLVPQPVTPAVAYAAPNGVVTPSQPMFDINSLLSAFSGTRSGVDAQAAATAQAADTKKATTTSSSMVPMMLGIGAAGLLVYLMVSMKKRK